MAVRVGLATSQYQTLDMDVPQDSVIAHTLFIAMLHKLEADYGLVFGKRGQQKEKKKERKRIRGW